jgi:predicted nucleic acid-binding protein
MILVDTSVWIDIFSGRNTAHVAMLESLMENREDICLYGVILTEILKGIRNDKEYKKTESVLSDLIFLPMNYETFLLSSNICRTLRVKGITIRNSVDCMIAAVCIENNVHLLHNDRDFDLITQYFDLRVVDAEHNSHRQGLWINKHLEK